jgi:hypothetical protein
MVTQLVLPLHGATADPATAESAAEPLHAVVVDPTAAPTETSFLCVRV